MSLIKIKGVLQNYQWGGTKFISELIGVKKNKYAEYWMGAHESAPSICIKTNKNLIELISSDPVKILGVNVYKKFSKLPYLFKVLDVHDMLSIQVHPTKKDAEESFKLENYLGIPLNAKHRNYKDNNHKPEVMVALSEFWLLHGFKTESEIVSTLTNTPELKKFLNVFKKENYRELYELVMKESQEETNRTLKPLIDRILPLFNNNLFSKNQPEYWAAKAFQTFCSDDKIDKGIYSIFFFNIVKLNPTEGIFQDAGIPHAYLEGQNIELMANSDNVLRGGLSSKYIDVNELIKNINFKATTPKIIYGEIFDNELELTYKTLAPDFELSKIEINNNLKKYSCSSKTIEIIIILEGSVTFSDNLEKLNLNKGEVIIITANSYYDIINQLNQKAVLYKAKCPIS